MRAEEAREHSPSNSEEDEYEVGAVYLGGLKAKYLSPADMVVPLCASCCIHLFYIGLLIPIVILFYSNTNDLESCMDVQFDILLLSLFCLHSCILINNIFAMRSSFNAKAGGTNKCLNVLLNIRLVLNALEVLLVLYGVYTVLINQNNTNCWEINEDGDPVYILVLIFLAINFIVIISMWCCLCCCLSSSSSSKSSTSKPENTRLRRFLSTALFGEEASKITSSFYGLGGLINILSEGTPYSSAEIITGLHLVRMLQKHYGHLDDNCDTNKVLYTPITDPLLLSECETYTLYANAAYGIPLYSMSNPCAICCAPPCCLPNNFDDPFLDPSIPEADKLVLREKKMWNPVQIDNSSLKIFMKRTHCDHPQNDVLLVSQIGGMDKVNFYIVVDHHQKALVIAIRGTLSIGDTITDAQTTPILCEYITSDVACYMHDGIAKGAKDVFDKMMQSKAVLNFLQTDKYKEYDVVVCGHSLGGGTTVLLSIMMRYGTHPHLQYFLNDDRKFKAYAIAPPSCVDREFALKKEEELSQFLTCVILAHDVIPRLSFHDLINTRAAVSLLLAQLDKTNHGPWWVYKKAIATKKNTILEALPEDCIYCNNVSSIADDGTDVKHDENDDQTKALIAKSNGESCFISDLEREVSEIREKYDKKLEKKWKEEHPDEEYKNDEAYERLWNIRFCQAGKVVYIDREQKKDDHDANHANECCECTANICKFICRSMVLNVCQCRCCLDPKDMKYKAYVANIDLFCDHMLFSSDMMPDHMPHVYLDALQRLQAE